MTTDDLQRWVREAHSELRPSRDLSSRTFSCKLRRDMSISSRKITALVSKRQVESEDQIIMDATAFTLEINDKISDTGLRDENIWNSDQSEFEYEPIRNRTRLCSG